MERHPRPTGNPLTLDEHEQTSGNRAWPQILYFYIHSDSSRVLNESYYHIDGTVMVYSAADAKEWILAMGPPDLLQLQLQTGRMQVSAGFRGLTICSLDVHVTVLHNGHSENDMRAT